MSQDEWRQDDPEPQPPQNVEVEQALLGAMLTDNRAYERVSDFLKPEHFFDPLHRQIFEVMAAAIVAGRTADPKTLRSALPGVIAIREAEGITIAEYLTRLVFEATSVINAQDYGEMIRDLFVRREMMEFAVELGKISAQAPIDERAGKLIDKAEHALESMRLEHLGKHAATTLNMTGTIAGAMDLINRAHMGQIVGYPWPLPEIGIVMSKPAQAGHLHGWLGASGDGKSSLAIQWGRERAEDGTPFYFLSGEQSAEECVLQAQAQRLGIPLARMLDQDGLTNEEADLILEDAKKLERIPFVVEYWQGQTVAQLGVKIRGFARKFGPGIFVIDHAKKIANDNRKETNLGQIVSQVYGGLKDIAGDLGMSGHILMQRSSDFMRRRSMKPIRSDPYGGEGTLQNLDGCLWLYRPTRWLRQASAMAETNKQRAAIEDMAARETGRVWFGCLKNRFGPEHREAKAAFNEELTLFTTLDREREHSSKEEDTELPL